MRTSLVVVALGLLGCGDDASTTSDAASIDGPVPTFDPLVGAGPIELVQGGYMFTEGPQWRATEGDLVFTDIPASTIYSMIPGTPPTVLRMPSANANGLAVDAAGLVIAAEHGSRSVTRDAVAIASTFEGDPLNSPNDVVVADDGTIYFTDPPYGLGSTPSALGFMGVFRLASDGALTAEHRGASSERPNGIGLSPDGTTLYVADTSDGYLYTYAVGEGGALGPRTSFERTAGSTEGLAIDTGGNIFVTTGDGIEAFSPSAQRWGVLAMNEQPANCAFGGPDARTLYITARTSVYSVRLEHAGLPRR